MDFKFVGVCVYAFAACVVRDSCRSDDLTWVLSRSVWGLALKAGEYVHVKTRHEAARMRPSAIERVLHVYICVYKCVCVCMYVHVKTRHEAARMRPSAIERVLRVYMCTCMYVCMCGGWCRKQVSMYT